MSLTDLSTAPEVASCSGVASRHRAAGAWWGRVALVCTLLLVSGGVRWWQARRIGAALVVGRQSPFRLSDLPLSLGDWRGVPTTADEELVRATGATDHTFRRYVNQSTGVVLEAYILYGPAVDLFIHSPEVCYPAAGFTLKEGPEQPTIETHGVRAPFRSLLYQRGEGGQGELHEVYYSWRFQDRWSPNPGKFKQLERLPGMFKVQLDRRVMGQERRDVGNPCEALLQELLPEIERRCGS